MAAKRTGDRYLSISDAARLVRVSRQLLHGLISKGTLRLVERRVVMQLVDREELLRVAEQRGWIGKKRIKRGRPTKRKKK